ncbi:MAG: alpha/beta hydrolase [Acidimicrobiia bacterium]
MIEDVEVTLVSVETGDGVRLHGALAGRPGGPAVLGVHGAWGNFYATPVFELVRQAAERGALALTLNGRGHDLGGADDGAPSIGLMRERLELAPLDLEAARQALEARGGSRYVVVAHSYGCTRATYWLARTRPPGCVGLVLLTPPPPLWETSALFVDGDLEDHFSAARRAVAEGDPDRLVLLRPGGRMPVIAEAATVMSIWAPESSSRVLPHLPHLDVPTLVVVGGREPDAYLREAELALGAARDAELVVLEGENHYYRRDRAALGAAVYDWIERRQLFAAG